MLWAIGLCSVLALAVTLERLIRLLPLNKQLLAEWMVLERAMGRRETALLSEHLSEKLPLHRVVSRAESSRQGGREAVRVAALEAAQREVPILERGLSFLAIIAQVAPLLGLLGTVVGLMEAFQAVGDSERIVHKTLASGIYKALGTTAAGLAVAIPAYIAYSMLSGVANRQIDQLQTLASELPALLLPEAQSQ